MFQLIKQVLKSFKKSIFVLIGLIFIVLAIIYSSFGSYYFSSNIKQSLITLRSRSREGNVVVDISPGSLISNNISYDVSEASLLSLKPKVDQENNKYFSDYSAYTNYNKTFAYEPEVTYGFPLDVKKVNKGAAYLFAYYSDEEKNPFFEAPDVNNPNRLYTTRARGILKSYGEVPIPQGDKTKWRAFGISLEKYDDAFNLDRIIYEIDPLTGRNVTRNGFANSVGYFDDGVIIESKIGTVGNVVYPEKEIITTESNIDNNKIVQYPIPSTNKATYEEVDAERKNTAMMSMMVSGATSAPMGRMASANNQQATTRLPIFARTTTRYPNTAFDLRSFTPEEIIRYTNEGHSATNVFSSIYRTVSVPIPVGNINWDLAPFSPFYEYIKIFNDLRYLRLGDFRKQDDNETNKSFIFNVHLDESKLTQLQKDTLVYVRNKYGEKAYNDIVRFTYYVKAAWIKEELDKQFSGDNVKYKPDNWDSVKKFDTLESLKTIYKPKEGLEEFNGYKVIFRSINSHISQLAPKVQSKLNEYEKEYLATSLSQNNNDETKTDFILNSSFNVTDATTQTTYIVSLKDDQVQSTGNTLASEVNRLDILSGLNLQSSDQVIGSNGFALNKVVVPGNQINFNDPNRAGPNQPAITRAARTASNIMAPGIGYDLNPRSEYLINLVNFIDKSSFPSVNDEDKTKQEIKAVARKIINDYFTTTGIVANDYYKMFALLGLTNVYDNQELINTNDQNLSITFAFRSGADAETIQADAVLITPYSNAIVVTENWLKSSNKAIVDKRTWENALNLDGEAFLDWIKELGDRYKISINSKEFVIIGVGQSSENAFPITDIISPLPDPSSESLVFLNKQGYNAVRLTNPLARENIYYSIYNNNKEQVNSQELASQYSSQLKGLVRNVYAFDDLTENRNILTVRNSLNQLLNNYIQLASSILIALLVLIGIYLSHLLIKIYIEKNHIALSIAKANGVSNLKIIFALSFIGLIIALVAGIFGYVISYFTQFSFLSIINRFWFVQIFQHEFSYWAIFLALLIIYFVFLLFVVIGVLKVFRKPVNVILNQTAEFKVNKIVYLLKSRYIPISSLSKFNSVLVASKLGRFVLFVFLFTMGMSLLGTTFSVNEKFNTSSNSVSQNRKYRYKFDLTTPFEQAGLFKIQNYDQVGISDPSLGIYSIYESRNRVGSTPYIPPYGRSDLTDPDLLALRGLDGNVLLFPKRDGSDGIEKRYYTNLVLPSVSTFRIIEQDLNSLENGVLTRWLLDLNISTPIGIINSWRLIQPFFPEEVRSQINSVSNDFLRSVLAVPEIRKINDEKRYILFNRQTGSYQVNSQAVLDRLDITQTERLRLNDGFLKFIGIIYGNKELSSKDVKITFNILPFENINDQSEVERYTYLDGTITNKNISISSRLNNNKSVLEDVEQKIMGIRLNSNLVTLVDENNNPLNHLLSKTQMINGKIHYPVVINQGASYRYNLHLNSTFTYTIRNSYFRKTDEIFGTDVSELNKYNFVVVGISGDSFGSDIFTNQLFANKVLNLDFESGAAIIGRRRRVGNETHAKRHELPKNWQTNVLVPLGGSYLAADTYDQPYVNDVETMFINTNSIHLSGNNMRSVVQHYVTPRYEPEGYIPFNGILTREEKPLFTRSLFLYSTNGLWASFSSFTDNTFANLLTMVDTDYIYQVLTPISRLSVARTLKKEYNTVWNEERLQLFSRLKEMTAGNNASLINLLNSTFGRNNFLSIQDPQFFETLFTTYVSIFNSIQNVQTLVLVLFLPIILMIIITIVSVMMNDARKMMAVLKVMGYSDQASLRALGALFLPAVTLGISLGVVVMISLLTIIQFFVYNLSSIFLSAFLEPFAMIIGIGALLAIIFVNFIYVVVYLKRQSLKETILNF